MNIELELSASFLEQLSTARTCRVVAQPLSQTGLVEHMVALGNDEVVSQIIQTYSAGIFLDFLVFSFIVIIQFYYRVTGFRLNGDSSHTLLLRHTYNFLSSAATQDTTQYYNSKNQRSGHDSNDHSCIGSRYIIRGAIILDLYCHRT